MSGNESDSVQLVEYRGRSQYSRARPSARRGRDRPRYDVRSGGFRSDSEIAARNFEYSTEGSKGCFSEEESLPSVRAHLAASLRYQEKMRSDEKETTPLLADSALQSGEMEGGEDLEKGGETDSPSSGYQSLASLSPKEEKRVQIMKWYNRIRIALLAILILVSVALFAVNEEHEREYFLVSIHDHETQTKPYTANQVKDWKFITADLKGPFHDKSYHQDGVDNFTDVLNGSHFCNQFVFLCTQDPVNDSCPDTEWCESVQVDFEDNLHTSHSKNSPTITRQLKIDSKDKTNLSIYFMTDNDQKVDFTASIRGEIISRTGQIVISFVILVMVYVFIAFDIIHRTLAAMIGSTCTLGVLSMLNKRPTLESVVEWIDLDTISLLFGMMTLVAIFSQTGFFDYSAVKAYKLAKGKVWPLITLLCFFSAIVSAFLDNVTTILLLTPVSIRLCQVLNLDPRPVLIAEVVFSNIGGTATAIGDPPNVIIVSSSLIRQYGINFPEFTLHLFLGIIFCMVVAYVLLSFINCFKYIRLKNKDPPHISELKREIAIWERTARRLPIVSLEERAVRDALRAKANEVRQQLRQEVNVSMKSALDMWQKNLAELEQKYRITNRVLLVKSSVVLLVVILLFFLSNTIPKVELDLGWIAIFGAVVLLILADVQELETVLHKIEWGTLLFFAALFILMEGLAELGLISFIGDTVVSIIKDVPKEHQMLVAIIIVLWVSALASSFIDNIPFTTATIPVIVDLAQSSELCVSIRPLVWALAFGACLGGNGTLIGASANVVCAGIAEQNGYRISFKDFFKIGFPMMLVTTFTAMCYLLICHTAFHWNTESARACVAAG